MTETPTPRIVTPQEALDLGRAMEPLPAIFGDLAYTVATEPERIAAAERAAVVKALRDNVSAWTGRMPDEIRNRADAIENGAPL